MVAPLRKLLYSCLKPYQRALMFKSLIKFLQSRVFSKPVPVVDPVTSIVKRYRYQTSSASASGTFFKIWGGWASADHVYTAMQLFTPPFIKGEITRFEYMVDAIMWGVDFPSVRPAEPVVGQRVRVYGYPRASSHITYREGTVYANRRASGSPKYLRSTWIIQMDEIPADGAEDVTTENVSTGMSGGACITENGDIIGILVTEGHPLDLDRDGLPENTCDICSLSSVWDAYQDINNLKIS